MEKRIVELTQELRSSEARSRKLEGRVAELEAQVAEIQATLMEMFQSATTRLQGVVSKTQPTATNVVPKTPTSRGSNEDPPCRAPTTKTPCSEALQDVCVIDKAPSKELSQKDEVLDQISLYPSEEARSRVKRRRGLDVTSPDLKHGNGVDDGWKVEEASVASGDPVMPASVKQMTEGAAAVEISVEERVRAWQASSVQGLESDSDDPLSMLQSRGQRWKEPFRDASGEQLTLERLGRVWSECGWVPMDDIPQLYYKHYGVDMWPRGEARKAHNCLRDMSGLGEWQQAGGKLLLFLQGSHLKSPRHFKRLFVRPNVPQSLLFFFLVTTVLRPLDLSQGPVVLKLWMDNFSRSPMQVPIAARPDGAAGKKWVDVNEMWQDAVSWLQSLARSAARYGRKYLVDKVVAWDPDLPPSDADAGLVSGLAREELLGLLAIAPILLRSIMHPDDILSLEDELAEPI
ncbi:hypothetical protein EV183_004964 [Coemansia sp. RSA 2336]|nr:hypothetical protein EV183_004964 [Coemansia sp. RSA 2336]